MNSRDLRAVQKLPFCYLCGKTFATGDKRNRDHVPPRSCIALKDQPHSPVILPTHASCNSLFSIDDERVGQFLSLLHGRLAPVEKRRLHYGNFSIDSLDRDGRQIGAVCNVDMYGVVQRWVRAFHAALYQQPMPQGVRFAIELPFDVVSPVDGSHIVDDGRPVQREFCEKTIARNRLTRTVDLLAGWSGKLQYTCVWVSTQAHLYCVFGLDFYSWHRMARLSRHKPRDCVGLYTLFPGELPAQASKESNLMTNLRDRSFVLR